MSTTDPIAALAAQTQASANAAKKKASDLGIDDFLALMTAQLKNQDPMKPLDSTEFVAQLAQFGTVSGVQNMQTSLTDLANSLRSTQVLQGTSLVGHDILAPTESVNMGTGGTVSGELTIPEGTSTLKFTIKDASGQIVRHIDVGSSAGTHSFTWDGLDDRGVAVPAGTYDLEAVAAIGDTSETVDVLITDRVSSVTIDAGGSLTLNTAALGPLALADVRRVM